MSLKLAGAGESQVAANVLLSCVDSSGRKRPQGASEGGCFWGVREDLVVGAVGPLYRSTSCWRFLKSSSVWTSASTQLHKSSASLYSRKPQFYRLSSNRFPNPTIPNLPTISFYSSNVGTAVPRPPFLSKWAPCGGLGCVPT